MAIKAADYTVGFDTVAARAQMVELEKAIQNGTADAATAFARLRESFNQVTNAHRTGKKDVDAFAQLIKDEKHETRTLGFLMRNASESVGALSETLGGPNGLGRSIGNTYSRFDQLNFALEGVAAAGEKAGGSLAKYAGILGGIALPAGIALTAFSYFKEEVENDEKQIKALEERIRALNVELGLIPSTKLEELNRQIAEVANQTPEAGFWQGVKLAVDQMIGSQYFLNDIKKQNLAIDAKSLELAKLQREEMEKQKQLAIQKVRDNGSFVESQMRNVEVHARLISSDETSLDLLKRQYGLRQAYIESMEFTHSQLRASGATTKELLEYDTQITAEKIKQKELQQKITEERAREASRRGDVGMLGIIDVWKQEYNFLQNAQKRLIMEARNAPLKLRGVASGEPTSTEEVLEKTGFNEYQNRILALGGTLAQSLTSGFTKGFQSGKFMLSDFVSSMMQSIVQMAAQEAAISAVAGLLSLIPGVGSFVNIAGVLGSRFFKGKTNSRVGESGSRGAGVEIGQTLRSVGGSGALATITTDKGTALLQQLVSEARETRAAIRNSRPALYVGGVTTPDAIVTENIGVAERRRARRLK